MGPGRQHGEQVQPVSFQPQSSGGRDQSAQVVFGEADPAQKAPGLPDGFGRGPERVGSRGLGSGAVGFRTPLALFKTLQQFQHLSPLIQVGSRGAVHQQPHPGLNDVCRMAFSGVVGTHQGEPGEVGGAHTLPLDPDPA